MVANTARVSLWGNPVGALVWDDEKRIGSFEYFPEFIGGGLEIAPLTMPLSAGTIYTFPGLNPDVYKGLPACLSDSLCGFHDTWTLSPRSFGHSFQAHLD
ncbi:hypothetical protein A256_09412, partial [Pseudomonas syringae pv. actinidiae ICMP 19103]